MLKTVFQFSHFSKMEYFFWKWIACIWQVSISQFRHVFSKKAKTILFLFSFLIHHHWLLYRCTEFYYLTGPWNPGNGSYCDTVDKNDAQSQIKDLGGVIQFGHIGLHFAILVKKLVLRNFRQKFEPSLAKNYANVCCCKWPNVEKVTF